ncbi:hypothetical protein FBU31_002335 [Coemansia sp. 'formosensis']|nr:hypothetical protein FBU31_002335 [Coemansia sp. 'formosensis']
MAHYSVCILISGSEFESTYTKGDNKLVGITELQMSTAHYLSKSLPADHIMAPKVFATKAQAELSAMVNSEFHDLEVLKTAYSAFADFWRDEQSAVRCPIYITLSLH